MQEIERIARAALGELGERFTHVDVRGESVRLFISPVALLRGETWKAQAIVHVDSTGKGVVEHWFSGRSHTPPEMTHALDRLYEEAGYYRSAAAHVALLARIDAWLRDAKQAGEIDVSGGLTGLSAEWQIYVHEAEVGGEHAIQGERFDDHHQRFDISIDAASGAITEGSYWEVEAPLE
jgi:hypothetical protein